MLFTSDLFLNCIILLMNNNSKKNKTLVDDLIDIYKKNKLVNENDKAIILFYIRIINKLLKEDFDINNKENVNRFILYIKSSDIESEKRKDLIETFERYVTQETKLSESQQNTILDEIKLFINWDKCNRAVKRAYGSVMSIRDISSPKEQYRKLNKMMSDLQIEINNYNTDITIQDDENIIDSVDFANLESIVKASKKHEVTESAEGLYLGIQGLNSMFGKHKKIRRGESIMFNALTHNFKSSMLQSIAAWIPLYNKLPEDVIIKKKPLIIFVSLENEVSHNYNWLSQKLYYSRVGKPPDQITEDELNAWVFQFFKTSSFQLLLFRYDPKDFGYDEYVDLINRYKNRGYDIYACIIDYLTNMKKTDDRRNEGAHHLNIKNLYNRVCNFSKKSNVTLITAHQLNRKAQELVNTGVINVVKKFNLEHLAESVDVEREVDTSIYLNIETNYEDESYLTIHRVKRRYDLFTPKSYFYCAYKFDKDLGIVDDFYTNPTFTRNIYKSNKEEF